MFAHKLGTKSAIRPINTSENTPLFHLYHLFFKVKSLFSALLIFSEICGKIIRNYEDIMLIFHSLHVYGFSLQESLETQLQKPEILVADFSKFEVCVL